MCTHTLPFSLVTFVMFTHTLTLSLTYTHFSYTALLSFIYSSYLAFRLTHPDWRGGVHALTEEVRKLKQH